MKEFIQELRELVTKHKMAEDLGIPNHIIGDMICNIVKSFLQTITPFIIYNMHCDESNESNNKFFKRKKQTLATMDINLLIDWLKLHNFNVNKTARELKVDRTRIYARLKKESLTMEEIRGGKNE